MAILETATEEELAEIKHLSGLTENLLLRPEDLLLEIRAKKEAALIPEKEAKALEQKVNLPGRDAEEFLKEVFYNPNPGRFFFESKYAELAVWKWHAEKGIVDMHARDPSRHRLSLPNDGIINVSVQDSFSAVVKTGIPALIKFLKGRRILSCRDSNGCWVLKILNEKDTTAVAPEPIKFVERPGETRIGVFDYRAGDVLRVTERGHFGEILDDAMQIEIVGWGFRGNREDDLWVILQLDGGEYIIEKPTILCRWTEIVSRRERDS